MNILDEYIDNQGVVFRPRLVTENYCYLRADHYGRIFAKMVRIDESGELNFNRAAYGFRPGTDDPTLWMQKNSESLPQEYVCTATQKVLDEHGICKDCNADELVAHNMQRLRDSKQAILDSEEARRLEQEGAGNE